MSLLSGGGISWFFTIRWTRKQEENNATKTSQEIYQSIITDLNTDRARLVEEKGYLRHELDDTREHVRRLDTRLSAQQGQVQLVNRKLNAVLPMTCAIAPTCETKKKLNKSEVWHGIEEDPQPESSDGSNRQRRRVSSRNEESDGLSPSEVYYDEKKFEGDGGNKHEK